MDNSTANQSTSQPSKLMITYTHEGKKYKVPFVSDDKTIGDLKNEIARRLQAIKIDIKLDEHHLLDKDGIQLFDEDLVSDFLDSVSEVELKNTKPVPVVQQNIQNLQNVQVVSGNISQVQNPNTQFIPTGDFYKDKYHATQISKEPVGDLEKTFILNFLPTATQAQEESKNTETMDTDDSWTLSYRIIQGYKPLAYEKIKISKQSNLEQLSEKILTRSGYDITKFRGALFNEAGIPLSKNLMLLVSIKVEDVLSDSDSLYVVLTPAEVDAKTLPKMDHSIGTDQIFISHNGSQVVRVELATATVAELKQKIYNKHDIPTGLQSLFYGGKPLNDNLTLQEYGVQTNSNLQLSIRPWNSSDSWGFQLNFFSPSLIHTKQQSPKGIREFRSHLMSIVAQVHSEHSAQYTSALLGYMRDLTQNNAPLIYALYTLLHKNTLILTQKIALEEGFLNLFANVLIRSPERPKNIISNPETIFENTRAIFAGIFKHIDSLPQVPQLWKDRETYLSTESICAVSFQPLKQPIGLRFDNGTMKICDRTSILAKINAKQAIAGIATLGEDLFVEVPETERIIRLQRIIGAQTLDQWKPKDKTLKGSDLVISDWLDLATKAQNHKILKIYSALEIKNSAPEYSMTRNEQKELILYSGKNKDVNRPINTYDVMVGDTTAINADDLADTLSSWQTQATLEPVINRTPKEAIIVLLDISGSMKSPYFNVAEMDRMSAVKSFFGAFADRTMAYDFQHVISLVLFNNKLTLKCDFTELFTQFKAVIDTAKAESTTALYDALIFGVERLDIFEQKYPGIVKRIIALTDGEDTASSKNATMAAKAIQKSNVILDSFVVGDNCDGLKKITFATGGYCFCPRTLNEAMRLFEGETILRASIREERAKNPIVNNDLDLDPYRTLDFTKVHIPVKLPSNIDAPVTRPKNVIHQIASNQALTDKINPSSRLKRIVREIHNYTADPHPFIQIFPGKDDITFWKVLVKGPELTPYVGGAFVLYVTFPDEYPKEAPNVRFLTQIYHCNINAQGRICHSVLDRNYTMDTTMKVIFDCIFGLLLTPEPEDPLDNYLATEFLSDREKYEENAKKLTQSKANKNIDALTVEFLGVETGDNQEDADLHEKMKDFESWLTK